MSNPAVLKPMFRKQTSKWQKLGQDHLKSIMEMSEKVAMKILAEVCKPLNAPAFTSNDLGNVILASSIMQRNKQLRDYGPSVTKLPLSRGTLATSCSSKSSLRHSTSSLGDFGSWAIVDLNNINDLFDQMQPRGVQNTEDEIHDLLETYYEIALEDFLSHIHHRIVGPFFQDKHGPVLGLSTDYILSLSEERIEMLGAEDKSMIDLRKYTIDQIKRLEDTMRIADHAWRWTKGHEG